LDRLLFAACPRSIVASFSAPLPRVTSFAPSPGFGAPGLYPRCFASGWHHPPLIADHQKSPRRWINITSNSAKSFIKPLNQLVWWLPKQQTS
jgi:hypothetical protein